MKDLLTARLTIIATIVAGVAIALYWCINDGPCGSICDSIPGWLASALGLCQGPGSVGVPGPGGAQDILDAASALPAVSSLTNYAVSALSPGASPTLSCQDSSFGSCAPASGDNGVVSVGGSS